MLADTSLVIAFRHIGRCASTPYYRSRFTRARDEDAEASEDALGEKATSVVPITEGVERSTLIEHLNCRGQRSNLAKPWRTCQKQAIYAASRTNQLRKSSSAASQLIKRC
jgi:hypothetical protein